MALLEDLIKTGIIEPPAEAFPGPTGLALVVKEGEECLYIKNEAGNMIRVTANQVTINSIIDAKASKDNVLELDNTDVYSPSSEYHPATKKYVDELSVDAYTTSETDTLLSNKLGATATATNSDKLGGQTLAQVQALGYDTDREWKFLIPGHMQDGFAEYGMATIISSIPTVPAGKTLQIRMQLKIAFVSFGYISSFVLAKYFHVWAGQQTIGTDLTDPPDSISAPGATHNGTDGKWTRASDGVSYAEEKYWCDIDITPSKLEAVGSSNGYGCGLYLYDGSDHLKDMSYSKGSIYADTIMYRFV